jgi:hypothetical protein
MHWAVRGGFAAIIAVIVETVSVWVLVRVPGLPASLAFALAFSAGYVALFALLQVTRPSSERPALGTQLRAYGLFGLGALLVVEGALYFCTGLMQVGMLKTNAFILIAVACWVALGWRFMRPESAEAAGAPPKRG